MLATYGAAGVLPPGHPCLVGLPPHVEGAGRLWDEADVVLAIGSDLDGVQTQNFMQPQPEDADRRRGSRRPTNYRVDVFVEGDAGRDRGRARRRRGRERDGGARRGLRTARMPAARSTPTALRFLDAIRFAVPADGNVVVDMCIPGYWLVEDARHATPAAGAAGLGTLGYAFPAALGAALSGDGPDGGPSRATAASCSRAANSRRWRRRRSR